MRDPAFVLSNEFRDVVGDIQVLGRKERLELLSAKGIVESDTLVGNAEIESLGERPGHRVPVIAGWRREPDIHHVHDTAQEFDIAFFEKLTGFGEREAEKHPRPVVGAELD
jgi:hypothetical protein